MDWWQAWGCSCHPWWHHRGTPCFRWQLVKKSQKVKEGINWHNTWSFPREAPSNQKHCNLILWGSDSSFTLQRISSASFWSILLLFSMKGTILKTALCSCSLNHIPCISSSPRPRTIKSQSEMETRENPVRNHVPCKTLYLNNNLGIHFMIDQSLPWTASRPAPDNLPLCKLCSIYG